MITVFWLEVGYGNFLHAQFETFDGSELSVALKFAERLRARRKAGEAISHVCLQSEMPEVVGEAGVSDAGKDYAWYKRRIDPAIKLGRKPTGDDLEVPMGDE